MLPLAVTSPQRKERTMKYSMEWTEKGGTRVKNQLFTAEYVSRKLQELEAWGCTNIRIISLDGRDEDEERKKL